MTDLERKDSMGSIMRSAREKHNVTQVEMAKAMNVSRVTVNKWENGLSLPVVDDYFKWFEILNEPIGRVIGKYLYPNSKLTGDYDISEIKAQLHEIIDNHLTDLELREVRFMLSSVYGSRYGFIQLCMANIQSMLGDRQKVANLISHNYKDAVALDKVAFPDAIQPDIEALDKAIEAGRNAYHNGETTYSLL